MFGEIIGGLLGLGGNLLGADAAASGAREAAEITAASNERALEKKLAAEKEARDIMLGRSDRGLADIDTGLRDYRATVAPTLAARPIVIPQYRGMTPQQKIGYDDLQREGLATLSASGLRGAGRAGIGSLMDSLARYRAGVAAGNDADTRGEMRRASSVADSARLGLGQAELQTGGAKANTNIMTGNQLASSIQSGGNAAMGLGQDTGRAGANAVSAAGLYNANAITNSGQLLGRTIGGLMAQPAKPTPASEAGQPWDTYLWNA